MPAADSRKNLRIIAILALLAVVIVVVVIALTQNSAPAPPLPEAAMATPAPTAAPAFFTTPSGAVATASAAPKATPDVVPAWEAKIDQILRSNADEAQMSQMLINLLPTLPEDGQIEAANHIANLLPDSNYNSVKPLLLNASLPESVLSVFFTDLMNRDDPTKLNSFLDIAMISNHPFHDEALSDLQIYVGDDYGTDWTKWKSAISDYLKNANQQ